jgi:hypothetical protein
MPRPDLGGKFTTFRVMARDAIDAALGVLGEDPRRAERDERPEARRRRRPARARPASRRASDRITAWRPRSRPASSGVTAGTPRRWPRSAPRRVAGAAGPGIDHIEAEVVGPAGTSTRWPSTTS